MQMPLNGYVILSPINTALSHILQCYATAEGIGRASEILPFER